MRRYAVSGPTEASAGPKTAVTVIGTAVVRPYVYDIMVGTITTPADYTVHVRVSPFTAAGTSAASPPVGTPLDSNDPAATCTCGWTHSAEPTVDAKIAYLNILLNQRATFRWVAAPGGELAPAAATTKGVAVANFVAGAAVTMWATVHWHE